jgi:Predicted transcriptional regulator
MRKTKATRYDVVEYLRTPEEMAAYLEACLEEANGDAAFVARLSATSRGRKACPKSPAKQASRAKASTKHFQVNERPASILF